MKILLTRQLILAAVAILASKTAMGEPAPRIPPIVPASDEVPIRSVPVFSLNQELQQCIKGAAAVLIDEAHSSLHARVGETHAFFNQQTGYVLRADFIRDDVPPPLINRIVCWPNGQLIVLRLSVPGLVSAGQPLAVPQARPH